MKITEPQLRILAAIKADDQRALHSSKQFQRLIRTLRDRGLVKWALGDTLGTATRTGYALTAEGLAALGDA